MATNGTTPVTKKNWILGEKFDARMPHHDGIKALWETKWKFPCTISVYPFHDGKFEDFEPVFDHLIKNNINDGYGDAYTEAFFPTAEKLTRQGDELAAYKNFKDSSDLYLRAACLYRISRFPYISSFPKISSEVKWKAWEAQKVVYMKAGSKWEEPVKEVIIPFVDKKGADRDSIPVYIRVPKSTPAGKKPPMVLLLTGLDGYRPDNTQRSDEFLKRGWGTVIAEVPGTADCPADPGDPESPDRLWTSVLDWVEKEGVFDMEKVMVWGLSTGGYYAVRIAHTHKERLIGVVAQGAGTHYFFARDWLQKADGHDLAPAMALKHGYSAVEEMLEGAQKKFSLLENGILEKPSTRLFFINGVNDGLMPIEDSMLPFEYGTPKEARFFQNALHMGYPMANAAVYPWMESLMESMEDITKTLRTQEEEMLRLIQKYENTFAAVLEKDKVILKEAAEGLVSLLKSENQRFFAQIRRNNAQIAARVRGMMVEVRAMMDSYTGDNIVFDIQGSAKELATGFEWYRGIPSSEVEVEATNSHSIENFTTKASGKNINNADKNANSASFTEPEVNYTSKDNSKLRVLLRDRGLSDQGPREKLIKRLENSADNYESLPSKGLTELLAGVALNG
ncbi:hypothetical protein G7Y89_g13634 [Cudoniella acicularis]|uniref:SAP domain-containing protein n=1 Tax=Cudoniella acicularis TaxID=354080 RepID=A0A8H4R995_9HELO|nr:hypothetical protein G7Y89_g13634 [Cudoniella acicularis]